MTRRQQQYNALRSLTAAVGGLRNALGSGRRWHGAVYMRLRRAHKKACDALAKTTT